MIVMYSVPPCVMRKIRSPPVNAAGDSIVKPLSVPPVLATELVMLPVLVVIVPDVVSPTPVMSPVALRIARFSVPLVGFVNPEPACRSLPVVPLKTGSESVTALAGPTTSPEPGPDEGADDEPPEIVPLFSELAPV